FAMGFTLDVIPNFVGGGLGATPEWAGSKDYIAGIVPGARVEFSEHRFAELYGPLADVNVLNVPNWEFGPMVNLRFGRSSVKDDVVNKLPEINWGLEGGAFVGYNYTNIQAIPYRVRVGIALTTGLTGDATGMQVSPYASLWVPLSPKVF